MSYKAFVWGGVLSATLAVGGVAQGQQVVDYYLNHGFTNNCHIFDGREDLGGTAKGTLNCTLSTAQPSNPSDWLNFAQWTQTAANTVRAGTYDSDNSTLSAQGQQLYDSINQGSLTTPFVLLGHSQGGLRARDYIQLKAGAGNPNLKALITIGTPHAGTPIVNGVRSIISQIRNNLSVASFGISELFVIGYGGVDNILTKLVAGNPVAQSAGLDPAIINSLGAQELTVGSTALETLNNIGTYCRWEYQGWWIFGQWVQICQKQPNQFPVLPASLSVLSVVGTNNNLYEYAPEALPLVLGYLNTVRNVQGASCTIGVVFLIGIPACISLGDLNGLLSNLPTVYQDRIVGSREGDAFINKYSQNVYSANPFLGGNGFYREIYATHSGNPARAELNIGGTRNKIREFQGLVGLKPGLELPPCTKWPSSPQDAEAFNCLPPTP